MFFLVLMSVLGCVDGDYERHLKLHTIPPNPLLSAKAIWHPRFGQHRRHAPTVAVSP